MDRYTVELRYSHGLVFTRSALAIPRIGEMIQVKHDSLAPVDEQATVEMVVYNLDNHIIEIYLKSTGHYES